MSVLPHLGEAELIELGLPMGPRKKLLAAIAVLQSSGQAQVDAPRSRREVERRQLTVMFCDLVGSTALSRKLDAEDLRHITKSYMEAWAEEVRRYDGVVAKTLGDGILAYFGYPQAHDDDAERAVRAGLGIVDGMTRLKPQEGVSLQARIGIATGLVVAGDLVGEGISEERAISGEAPNLAARLQQITAPNTVVLSDSTYRLLGGTFAFEELGLQTRFARKATARCMASLKAKTRGTNDARVACGGKDRASGGCARTQAVSFPSACCQPARED